MATTVHIHGTSATAKIRHPMIVFGLVFATLGVYYIVWYYKVNRELRDLGRATGELTRLGRRPFVSLLAITLGWLILVPPFVSAYRTFQRIGAAQDVTGTNGRVEVWIGFALYLVGLFTLPVELVYAQNELNRVWRRETARAPGPVSAVAAT